MSGGVAVRADPGRLADLAGSGAAVADTFGRALRSVRVLHETVRAACGSRAPWADGLDRLGRVRASVAETATIVDDTRRSLLTADGPLTVVSGTGGTALGPVVWPRSRTDERGRIPWLDPDTDSFVVGLWRAGTTGRPSPELLDRFRVEGPGVLELLTDTEFGTGYQSRLLIDDPERFAHNWWRAGQGVGSGVAGIGTAVGGLLVGVTPGGDDAFESMFDRRPGDELRAGIGAAAHDLVYDPDALARSTVGWEQFRDDRYRWLGTMLPELAAEAVTAALPVSVGRRVVSTAIDPSPGPRPLAAGPFPELAEFRLAETGWGTPDPITSHRVGPFEAPEGWIEHINGDGPGQPGRNNNCVDCARATEANWRGDDAVAAPLADPGAIGLPPDRLEDWTGGSFRPASIDEIHEQLTDLGPGSSAIITSVWDTGGAHAYNAVNDGGIIRWLDGQAGETATWPPPYGDHVVDSIVIFIGPDGTPR